MALPLILVGLRTGAIFVVATATIAAEIGLGGLGRYIIDGLASKNTARSPAAPCSWSCSRSFVLVVFRRVFVRLIVPAGPAQATA